MFLTIWDWIVLITTVIGIILYYGLWLNRHFKRKGVKYLENTVPFFGHMFNIFLGREHFEELIYKIYNKYKDEKYVGFYAFRSPIIIIKDLDLIRQVGIKDFEHFVDHRVFMDEDADPLFGKNLFFLRGQKWKDMRVSMSPAYTASKLKNMFSMMVECGKQSVSHFRKQLDVSPSKEQGYVEVEMKDVFTRYTNDVIASTAFGLKIDSLEDKSNAFYVMGKKATNFSGIQFLKFLGYGSMPSVMKFFKIPLFSPPVASFFKNLILGSIKSRTQQNIIRPDMIHLLMQAKKGSLNYDNDSVTDSTGFATIQQNSLKGASSKRDWSDDDLTAQAMAFLLAGFDTSSSLLCFIAYELALNPNIQTRLQEEIDDALLKCDGNLTYNELMAMKYMDMVVSETLRKWPPDGHLDRLCADSYTLPPPNEESNKNYELFKGHDIWIPTYSIHHDANHYPDPEKFDPERFSEENKVLIKPLTFIPFGIGPRFCIGARFAVMEAKVAIFYLLSNFNIITTSKTTIPLKLARDTFIMHSEGGFWLGLTIRNNCVTTF